MRSISITALLIAAALSLPSFAQKPEVKGGVAAAPGKAEAAAVATVKATVTAVDKATRTVTLKFTNGDVHSIVAGDEVRNFDQIKVGDMVTAKYAESVSISLKKGGTAPTGSSTSEKMARSKPGEKPGGVAVREINVVANVVAVDAANHKVSVKNDKGEVVDLNVQDPEQLKLVKVGDQVQATYTQALAISMEAAPAAAPKK